MTPRMTHLPRMTPSDLPLLTTPSPLRVGMICDRMREPHCDYVIKDVLKGIFSVDFEFIKREMSQVDPI